VPLELPGLSLSLLAQEHETMIGEVDSIVPFVGGLCAFIVLLLTLFLRALYLQLQAEHRLRNQEDLMLDQARLASLGEMTSVLSHELNQPIATIETYACAAKNLLAEGWSDEERASKQSQMLTALNMVTDQSHRAAEIIKSIRKLFASKSTSYEDVLISDILDNLYPIIAVQAERFQSKFKITYSGNYLLRVNRLLCEQVFLNLSRNAFQAMIKTPPSQRSLQVSVGISKNNFCKISFIDNGEGLSEEAAKNIFKPFFSSKADGMGLGLSLSRTLVERFGGELRWKNTSPRGAQFTILLPIQD
jgi:two-component system sensor histidine kinase DctS